jgi:DNA-binding NtrC family response regulator
MCCSVFEGDPALHHTPIIICTSAPKLKPLGDALQQVYGCDLLMKPFEIEDLEESVARSFGHSLEAVSSVRQKQDQP